MGFGRGDIGDVQERIEELRRLGAERIILPDIPIERMRLHAKRIAQRKAGTLSRLKEPRRTVEIGCWLRLQLLDLTDTVLEQTSRRIGQLWSHARALPPQCIHDPSEILAAREQVLVEPNPRRMRADALEQSRKIVRRHIGQGTTVVA